MNANNEKIVKLYLEALELAPQERAAFLAEACGDDDELRREVESLIEHARTDDSFLAKPLLKLSPTSPVGDINACASRGRR